MKHLLAVWIVCSLLLGAAFGILLLADRQLGVALPYSVPLAFGVVSLLAPVLFALANAVRLRRPVVVNLPPARVRSAAGARAADAPRPAAAEGVVLLDLSAVKGRAA